MIVNLIPMAGEGQRFKNEGYTTPKPLLDTDGVPMFVRAAKSLPKADLYIFVCRRGQVIEENIEKLIHFHFPSALVICIDQLTQGQAITCSMAQSHIPPDAILNIGPSDSEMIYDQLAYNEFLHNPDKDALIWTTTGDLSVLRNVNMYGWVLCNPITQLVQKVSCKTPVTQSPQNDPAIIGCFSFKRAEIFFQAVERMIINKDTINNEYYVDVSMNHLINLGSKVYQLDVLQYICWGTPADYETYLFWLKYFKYAR
ncbi:MAG: hypothetical protein ACK5PO_01900 [Bacteroidota bacterium]|jgi:bifunctional N-acetylglucosamine-1-phosphate-uridyltransferase/glucosamine-1-phosphate-acetyltransferase GlmU-like protein